MQEKNAVNEKEGLGKGFTVQGKLIKYQKLVKESEEKKLIAVYGKTKIECLEKFAQAEQRWRQEILLGINTKAGHVLLYDGMLEYFNKHSRINGRKRAIKRSTHSTNLRVLRNQIGKYPIGLKYADKIRSEDLQSHIERLVADGYAESTVKKAKDLLRAYYFELYNNSPANPAYSIIVPHIEDTGRGIKKTVDWNEILDDEEIVNFLKMCDEKYIPNHRGTQYADLLKFQFFTYMRIGESCALRVRDYERVKGNGYISIKSTLARDGKVWYVDTPKYRSSIRRIKLGKEAKLIIEKRIEGKREDDLIWSQKNGDYVKYTSLEKPFKSMLLRFGCKKELSVHSLRHTGISFALRHGANVAAVSKNAGHASIAITQDIYQHVLQTEKDEAVDLTEAALERIMDKNGNYK